MSSGPYRLRTTAFLLASALTLTWVASGVIPGFSLPSLLPGSAPAPQPPAASQSSPPQPEPLSQVSDPIPEPAPEPVPAQPEPPAALYDFSQPAPAREPVDNDYFQNAAFLGDSRTDGLLIYSGIKGAKNLTSTGITIYGLAEKKAVTIQGEKHTLLEALALEEYGKVYLSLGINELDIKDDEGFYQHYCQAIDAIRACQPNAVIYIQGLIPLNEGVIAKTIKRDHLTNERLRVHNDLMKQVARDKQVVFLDLYSEFVDENNELPAEASRDGVHLSREWCKKWLAYLQTHTVDFETLYPNGAPAPAAEVISQEEMDVIP